jgi:hypothetical protein
MPPQVEHPTLAKSAGIRPYTINDIFHMMLEMEYIMLVILAPEMYYQMHCFQICLQCVTPPMLGAHITKCQFPFMWAIDDLKLKKYLTYNIICYYI